MKKLLSLTLVLAMALSMLVLPAFAADEGAAANTEAKEISTAEAFLAMEATGSYKLTADITLTSSYEAGFTGTFDGQGHTVTTSVPMFADFGGTIKNLTVNGEVTGAAAVAAKGLCVAENATVVFENITNNANVTNTEGSAGALCGVFGAKEVTSASIKIVNCTNNGNITGKSWTGGIMGVIWSDDSKFTNGNTISVDGCVNNGKIVGTDSDGAAGIVGRMVYSKKAEITACVNNGAVEGYSRGAGILGGTTDVSLRVAYCVNTAEIKAGEFAAGIVSVVQCIGSADFKATDGGFGDLIEYCLNTGNIVHQIVNTKKKQTAVGGIVAIMGGSKKNGITKVANCVNTGNVTAEDANNSDLARNCVGGIVGCAYGQNDEKGDEYPIVTNCITTGDVTLTWSGEASALTNPGTVAYFVGFYNKTRAEVTNNTASGTLTSSGTVYAFGYDKEDTFASLTGNKLPEGCEYDLTYENGTVTKTSDNKEGYAWTKADFTTLTSGEYVYNFNKAYKTAVGSNDDILFMVINGTDFAPTTKKADNNVVYVDANGAYSNDSSSSIVEPDHTKAPETTNEPDPTTKAPEPTQEPDPTTKAPEPTQEPESTTKAPDPTKAPDQTEEPGTEEPTGKKGCKSVVVSGIAVVVMAAAAVVALKKED